MSERLNLILTKIEHIEKIISNSGSITKALEDEVTSKPAIMMHLVSIAEQFQKIQSDMDIETISKFDKKDIRGALAVRNFIAHDYEGVNLAIVEDILRIYLPKIKKIIISTKSIANPQK
jgi:uncharacterized protein with HEPN domain